MYDVYAASGINAIMPTSRLCRLVATSRHFLKAGRWVSANTDSLNSA